ncbi:MAG: protein kinase [Acidobacteriota bacterium]|nr:MAG: protein kinase [Acidobacteriota bacterium]
MDPALFKRIEDLYHRAIELPAEERDGFVRSRSGGDQAVEERLKELLSFDDEFNGVVDIPPEDLAAELLSSVGAADLSGTDLGNFRIISKIGQGGMGTVYLAEDPRLDRKLAIKFVSGGLLGRSGALRRFELEAKTASALNHPNILTVYDIGDTEELRYIATEFIEGETLRDRLKRGAMELDEIADVAVQIGSALEAAHDAGIIHRDIKPGNIMIRPDGLVKVLDFGVAKLTESVSGQAGADGAEASSIRGLVVGTSGYMSPEQARAGEVDFRTDIFSFGVVLYQMLTGEAPFDGETHSDTVSSILEKEPVFENVPDAGEADDLQRIIGKAIKKDPEERYSSAGEMLADLRAFRARVNGANSTEGIRETSGSFRAGKSRRWLASAAAVLAIASIAGLYLYSLLATEARPNIEAVAVLPIVNLTEDPEFEAVADGFTESLIDKLSHMPSVKVKARSSVFRFKGQDVTAQEIGRRLAVDTVVLGEITKQSQGIGVNIEIVETATGNRLWGRGYTRDHSEFASLQNAIAIDILEELNLEIAKPERERLEKPYTASAEAFRHYLRGRYQWNKRTPDSLRTAIEEYSAAVESDPGFALAYVGLSDSYVLLENYTGERSSELLRRARAYASKALEADPMLPEAHASLGLVLHRSWEWTEAEREYKTAISLKPNYAEVRHWYSLLLRELGRFDESLVESKIAEQLDPLSGIIITNLAGAHLVLGDHVSAISVLQRSIALEPDFPWTHCMLALAEASRENFRSAVETATTCNKLAPESVNALSIYGYVLARAGKRDEAGKILDSLIERYRSSSSQGRNIARIYSGLGENDKAFEWLEKDFEARSAFLPYIRWSPPFEQIRSDPRYFKLLERMGMPRSSGRTEG